MKSKIHEFLKSNKKRMSKKHLLLSLALVSIGFSATLNAQCPVSSSSGGPLTNPSGLTMGQSFTVNCSGVIDSLELYDFFSFSKRRFFYLLCDERNSGVFIEKI